MFGTYYCAPLCNFALASRSFMNGMRILYGSVNHVLFWLFMCWFNANLFLWKKLHNFWVKKPIKFRNPFSIEHLVHSAGRRLHDGVIIWTVSLQHGHLGNPHGGELRDMCLSEHQCQVCILLLHIFFLGGVSCCPTQIQLLRTLLLFCKLLLLKALHFWKIFYETFSIYSVIYISSVSYST